MEGRKQLYIEYYNMVRALFDEHSILLPNHIWQIQRLKKHINILNRKR